MTTDNSDLVDSILEQIQLVEDEKLKSVLEQCAVLLSDWMPITCGECGDDYYAPECDCYKPESSRYGKHPLMKLFLREWK